MTGDARRAGPRGRRGARLLALAPSCLGLAAVVAGCGSLGAPTPTVVPAPTLVIVTVTPGPKATPAPRIVGRYVVRPGDTLSGIAGQFGVSEEAIVQANDLPDRDRVYAGQELEIPAPGP